jgi:hypothetical protein
MIYIYQDDFVVRGLFAYFWTVADVLRRLNDDDLLFVDLRKIGPYYDPNYKPTDNVWEYYFEQPCGLTLDCYDIEHTTLIYNEYEVRNNLIFGPQYGNYSLSDNLEDKDRLYRTKREAKKVITKFIRFQPHILEKVDKFYKTYFTNNVLGVHVRYGEMFTRGHSNATQLMCSEYYYPYIDKELDLYDKLLLITNNLSIREDFIIRYGNKLIYYDCNLLSTTDIDNTWLHNDRNYDKGEFAVIDCILLSMCQKKLVTASNLGCLSTLLNDNPCEFIDKGIYYGG